MMTGLTGYVFWCLFTSVFFLLCLGEEGEGDIVTGLTCAPVFDTLRSFATVLPSSSNTIISTSTTGDCGNFLASFAGGVATCLDWMLIDTAGSLEANGRRTDTGPSIGLGVIFFLVVDFLLVTDEKTFGLTGEGKGEASDTESSSATIATGGEKVVLPLPLALLKVSPVTIL